MSEQECYPNFVNTGPLSDEQEWAYRFICLSGEDQTYEDERGVHAVFYLSLLAGKHPIRRWDSIPSTYPLASKG